MPVGHMVNWKMAQFPVSLRDPHPQNRAVMEASAIHCLEGISGHPVLSSFEGTPLTFHGHHCQLLWGRVYSLHSLAP